VNLFWRIAIWVSLPIYVLGGALKGAGEGIIEWTKDREVFR
jgi:hypothetical protein